MHPIARRALDAPDARYGRGWAVVPEHYYLGSVALCDRREEREEEACSEDRGSYE